MIPYPMAIHVIYKITRFQLSTSRWQPKKMIDVSNSLRIHASVNHTITYKLIGLASFCLDI